MPRGVTVATIEARMTSSRFPGKVLQLIHGRPALEHLILRLQNVLLIDTIVVATTTNEADDVIVDFCEGHGVDVFRGSDADVLGRVLQAATGARAATIVETTADCPLLDPAIVDTAILTHFANQADYTSNTHFRSFPDGMDVQVINVDTLAVSESMTEDALDREHVTLHIRRHPHLFRQIHMMAPPNVRYPEVGLTLDTPEDLQVLEAVVAALSTKGRFPSCAEIIDWLHLNPDVMQLNAKVERKGDS